MNNLDNLFPSITKLTEAKDKLLDAESALCNAAQLVEGTPEDDRIMSLSMEVENLVGFIRGQIERMKVIA